MLRGLVFVVLMAAICAPTVRAQCIGFPDCCLGDPFCLCAGNPACLCAVTGSCETGPCPDAYTENYNGATHQTVHSTTNTVAIGEACFSGEAVVFVEGSGLIPIAQLRIGDKVLAWDNDKQTKFFDTVYAFMHRESASRNSEFLRVCHSNNACLAISYDHLVFNADGTSIFAQDAKVGSTIATAEGPATVISVEKIVSQGIFAPLTFSGNLIVDGVVASNYASGISHTAIHASFAPLRLWASMMGVPAAEGVESFEGTHPYAAALESTLGNFRSLVGMQRPKQL